MAYRFVLSLVIALFAVTGEASAEGLPATLDKMISAAATRDEASGTYRYLEVALVLVLDSQPEQADAARARALALAPQFGDQINSTFGQITSTYALVEQVDPVEAAAFTPPPAPAPAPEEKPEKPKPSGFWGFREWTGETELGFTVRRGGTIEDEITLVVDLSNERKNWTHNFRVRYEFLTKKNIKDEDDLLLAYQLNRLISERFYVFMLLHWRDEFDSGYDQRFLQTLGVGYHIFKSPKFALSVEAGPTHRSNVLTSMPDETFHEYGARITLNSTWDVFSWLDFGFKGSTTITNQNNSYEALVTLTSPLTARLSIRFSVEYEYDTDTPPEDEPDDLRVRSTLVYKF
jgi:putative salt-induced outer membrane protein YdiY